MLLYCSSFGQVILSLSLELGFAALFFDTANVAEEIIIKDIKYRKCLIISLNSFLSLVIKNKVN